MNAYDLGLEKQFISLSRAGVICKHFFPMLTPEMCEEYQREVDSYSKTSDYKSFEFRHDTTEADLHFYDRNCLGTEGYPDISPLKGAAPEGRGVCPTPPQDKLLAVRQLLNCSIEGFEESFTEVKIRLLAFQNNLGIHTAHIIRFPQTSELLAWNGMHAVSHYEYRRGANITRHSSRIREEFKLYCAMVTGIEGYSFKDSPLEGGGAVSARGMSLSASVMNPVHAGAVIRQAFSIFLREGSDDSPFEGGGAAAAPGDVHEVAAIDPLAPTPSATESGNS